MILADTSLTIAVEMKYINTTAVGNAGQIYVTMKRANWLIPDAKF